MSENNKLSFEDVDRLLAYDQVTGLLTWKVTNSNRAKAGTVTGAVNSVGYLHVCLHYKSYKAHHLAWLLSTGSWPAQQLDHINGNRADNRLDNLRECTVAENHQNKAKYRSNSSGVTGVGWYRPAKKWRAHIVLAGKQIHLGLFETIEEAAAAREKAKQRYHTFNPVDR